MEWAICMKPFHLLLPAATMLCAMGCSLVTVPVKTAGKIVDTTVRTSGEVVEAPFKAASGGYRETRIAPVPQAPPSSKDVE
jgi:hypothetical protein